MPDLPVRRVLALVRWLPPGSALHRSAFPDTWAWTSEHELLAAIAELIDLNTRTFVRAHTKKGAKQPKPVRIVRPKPREDAPRKPATAQEMRDFFGDRMKEG